MVDDVAYFQSDQKYTTVVTADGEALLRTPLRELLRGSTRLTSSRSTARPSST
jgi:DNA-binding LytR/AlgR family response regulator